MSQKNILQYESEIKKPQHFKYCNTYMIVNESSKTYKANELKISKHSLKCPTPQPAGCFHVNY